MLGTPLAQAFLMVARHNVLVNVGQLCVLNMGLPFLGDFCGLGWFRRFTVLFVMFVLQLRKDRGPVVLVEDHGVATKHRTGACWTSIFHHLSMFVGEFFDVLLADFGAIIVDAC